MEDGMKRLHFTAEEEQELLRLAEENRSILENKQSERIMWKLKEQTWENIAVTFYSNTGIKRSAPSLRVKYDLLRKKAKAAHQSSNGCPPPPKRRLSDRIYNGYQDGETNESKNSTQMDSPKRTRVESDNLCQPEKPSGLNSDHSETNPVNNIKQSQPNAASTTLPIIAPVLYNIKTIDLTDQLQHEKLLLLRAQKLFCEQENTRAQEKHMLEMESLRAKRELLLMEIAEKKQGRKS
ncbi:hypothetical protein KR026_001159 [Drosophila bipectinata]|nr:hypothetical protein KR026_001159 [Drosophila bipectinata]